MDDNFIECAHCGEQFFYDMIRCPNCGISVYLDENDREVEVHEESIYGDGMEGVLAVAVGWFVTGLIGVLIYIAMVWILAGRANGMLFQILRFASLPAGALLGGYIAMAMTNRRPFIMGALVGILSISFAVLIASYERDLATEPIFTVDMILWWITIVIGGVLGAIINTRLSRKAVFDQLFTLPESEDELYQELYIKVGYDLARVERLIDVERERYPEASRYYLLKNAIRHLERDNR